MQGTFIIAKRYRVDAMRNTITDIEKGGETKVEQRLISVLSLLAAHPNELVNRDTLIKEVWNDYGGADEGLTQAISFLRKLLNDTDKILIETVPKKGYILHADVTETAETEKVTELEKQENETNLFKDKKLKISALSIAFIIILILVFINRNKSSSPDILSPDKTDIRNDDSLHSKSPDLRPDMLMGSDTTRSEDIK